MVLEPGTRLGAYEVVAKLGEGGMGEVYKARDTRIDRFVAIKVLPAPAGEIRESQQRFEHEARALAALSHPRVCALFEFTRLDGHALLVMELLEGRTLGDRLAKGKLPLNDALRVGIEIAEGLAAAHEAGLIHRDLKPANVMLTRSGAKLVDFGLAKTVPASMEDDELTRQPLTNAGVLVGTVPFMAPEQLEGRTVDRRTDIWAFGCVLYEMVTGRRAFEGASPASVAAAILERDPPVASRAEPAAAGALDRVIARCLARDPDRRWQSAADLGDELAWIAGGGAAAAAPIASPARARWRDRAIGAAIVASLAVIPFLITRAWTTSPPPTSPMRRLEMTVPRLAAVESMEVSPDGSNLAFVAGGADGVPSVWIRSLADGTVRALSGTEGVLASCPPFWSPDGRAIAFVAGQKLRQIDLARGQVVTIAEAAAQFFGGSWSADGTILLGAYQLSKTHGIYRVAATGGTLTPVTRLGRDALLHASPKWLPDRQHFLFLSWAFDEHRRDLCVGSVGSSDVRCLGMNAHFLAGATERHVWYTRQGTLFARPFDPTTATVSGDPLVVAERLAQDRLGRYGVSVASPGTLVYQAAAAEVRQLVWVSRTGTRLGTVGDPAVQDGFDIDRDGKVIVVERQAEDGTRLWLIDSDRNVTTSIDVGGNRPASSPVLSPDGLYLAYLTQQDGRSVIFERPTRGGPSRLLFDYRGEGVLHLADRSHDGRQTLIGIAERERRAADLVPVSGGTPLTVAEGGLALTSARLSTDGRWLAYMEQWRVFVSPIPQTGERWQVSSGGGDQPQWRSDGRELFYLAPDGTMMSTSITTTPRFDFGAPRPLFKTDLTTDRFNPRFAVTADGTRFLLNMLRDGDKAATTTTLHVVLNWTATPGR